MMSFYQKSFAIGACRKNQPYQEISNTVCSILFLSRGVQLTLMSVSGLIAHDERERFFVYLNMQEISSNEPTLACVNTKIY